MRASAGALPAVDGSAVETHGRALAFDIGGTKLAAGVVDGAGTVHSFLVEPSQAEEDGDAATERLLELGRRAVVASGFAWAEIGSVGIACGGPLDAARGTVSPAHLPRWRELPLKALAEDAYDRTASLENDATAAAAGEHRFGAGVGTRNMVYLTISTGVGGGVVIDGRLYRGAAGNGGELGHVTVDWHGRECRACGRRGCLEAYVSGTSIAERAREAGFDGGDGEAVRATDVAAAAMAGDPIARVVWDETIEALACGLTSIVNAFEPELVVLGGGVMRAGDALLGPARERALADAIGPAAGAADVVLSALGEHVGVVGAGAIAFEQAASRGPVVG